MFKKIQVSLLVGALISPQTLASQEIMNNKCSLPLFFKQIDIEKVGNNSINYLRPIYGNNSVVIFSEYMKVNADGNIRAYSATDPSGNKCATLNRDIDAIANGCSMGHLANGMTVYKKKIDRNGKEKRIILNTQDTLKAFKELRSSGWKKSPILNFDFFAFTTQKGSSSQISVFPCETPNGFLASHTSTRSGLKQSKYGELPESCDPRAYLDSVIPSVVVPRCWNQKFRKNNPVNCPQSLGVPNSLNVQPGDIAVIRDKNKSIHYAIVGDFGGAKKLGEVSVGLAAAVAGKPIPLSYGGLKQLSGQRMDVMILPGQKVGGTLVPQNVEQMQTQSNAAFDAWQGSHQESLSGFAACVSPNIG